MRTVLFITALLLAMATPGLAAPSGRLFDSPEKAAEALAKAARSGDQAELLSVLGLKPRTSSHPAILLPTILRGSGFSKVLMQSIASG